MACSWCTVICEEYSTLADSKELITLSLEIGFRHLDPKMHQTKAELIHMDHDQQLFDIISNTGDCEAISDLLCAWALKSSPSEPHPLLKMVVDHIIKVHSQPFPPRLQQLLIHSIEIIDYQGFLQVGEDSVIRLLKETPSSFNM